MSRFLGQFIHDPERLGTTNAVVNSLHVYPLFILLLMSLDLWFALEDGIEAFLKRGVDLEGSVAASIRFFVVLEFP
jgi:hypothetical protein